MAAMVAPAAATIHRTVCVSEAPTAALRPATSARNMSGVDVVAVLRRVADRFGDRPGMVGFDAGLFQPLRNGQRVEHVLEVLLDASRAALLCPRPSSPFWLEQIAVAEELPGSSQLPETGEVILGLAPSVPVLGSCPPLPPACDPFLCVRCGVLVSAGAQHRRVPGQLLVGQLVERLSLPLDAARGSCLCPLPARCGSSSAGIRTSGPRWSRPTSLRVVPARRSVPLPVPGPPRRSRRKCFSRPACTGGPGVRRIPRRPSCSTPQPTRRRFRSRMPCTPPLPPWLRPLSRR